MKPEFKSVELVRIVPDPNQPRKFFDETAINELTDSIREMGVIQPIVIRPTEDGKYMVVTGERRYRASMQVFGSDKAKNTIPAVIRELTDQEALELQIVENLQRKEVHPMEEAVAFKSLHGTLSTAAIAQKVGKSESYVLKRMKLTELIEKAQDLLFQGKIEYSDALKLSRMDPQSQSEILEIAIKNHWGKEPFDVNRYLSRGEFNLDKAPFKTEDGQLYPEAGPCGSCPFNSATSPALFDDVSGRICHKRSCYEVKVNRNRERVISEAMAGKDVVLVSGRFYSNEERAKEKQLVESGLSFLKGDEYDEVYEVPESIMTFEEWKDYNDWDYETDGDEQAAKAGFENYLNKEKEEIQEFEKKVAAGEIKKAFVLLGSNQDKEIYVTVKKSVSEGNLDSIGSADVIAELKKREVRAKELDFAKKWANARQFLSNPDKELIPDYLNQDIDTMPKVWLKAWYLAMFNAVESYLPTNKRKEFKQTLEFGIFSLSAITRLLRFWIIKSLDEVDADTSPDNTKALYQVLSLHYPEQIAAIDKVQDEAAAKRQQRLNERIAALKKPKKEVGRQLDLVKEIQKAKEENQLLTQEEPVAKAKGKKKKELETA